MPDDFFHAELVVDGRGESVTARDAGADAFVRPAERSEACRHRARAANVFTATVQHLGRDPSTSRVVPFGNDTLRSG